jgi:hypothetical protein
MPRGGACGGAKVRWECEDGSSRRRTEAQKAEGGGAASAEVSTARLGEEGNGACSKPGPRGVGLPDAGWCPSA